MNYIKYNNFINSFKTKLFLALFLTKIIGILCISSGANEPIEMTMVGEMARDCALQYCMEKDSLGLWLSLQNTCSQNPNLYFLEINSSETNVSNQYSPIVIGLLCAISSVISLMLGYSIGHIYHKSFVYSKVKIEEDDF